MLHLGHNIRNTIINGSAAASTASTAGRLGIGSADFFSSYHGSQSFSYYSFVWSLGNSYISGIDSSCAYSTSPGNAGGLVNLQAGYFGTGFDLYNNAGCIYDNIIEITGDNYSCTSRNGSGQNQIVESSAGKGGWFFQPGKGIQSGGAH